MPQAGHANPQELRDIARNWRTAADHIDDHAQGIKSAVAGLNGAWEGASAEAFAAYCTGFTGVFGTLHDEVETAAGALEAAANQLETAKSGVEKIGGDTVDHCRPYLVAAPSDPPDAVAERLAAMRSIVQSGVSDAEPKLDDADRALADAATKIGNAVDFVGPRPGTFSFDQIQKAADLGFTPGPGRQVQWTPKPIPDGPVGTAPAAAQPGADAGPMSAPGGRYPGGFAAAGDGGGVSGVLAGGGYSGHHHAGGYSSSASGSGGGSGGDYSGGDSGDGGYAGGGDSAPSGPPPPGDVQDWIKQAIEIMRQNGVPVSDADIPTIWSIIQHESGGNPHAINNWDSNAMAGHPSKGLMQCIDSTFNAHTLPGHFDIYNPIDNIIAGTRYSISRYGSLGAVPGIRSMSHGGHYQGY